MTAIKKWLDQLKGVHVYDLTSMELKKSIWILAVPMILELVLESVFALVDLYFVGHLKDSHYAIQMIGLTESVNTIIYSIAIGLSVAVSAIIARKTGEKNIKKTGKIIVQSLYIALFLALIISSIGFFYANELFSLLGASKDCISYGISYPKIIFSNSIFILLLFLINGIFRGLGSPFLALKSLWIANLFNLALCPILINGWGPIQPMGIDGAGWATTIGRIIGVLYQLYCLYRLRTIIHLKKRDFKFHFYIINSISKIAIPGMLQYILASCSWIFLSHLIAKNGGEYGSAGFQTAVRIMMFFILPIWGLSNAAATLTGQFLGSNQKDKIIEVTKTTLKYSIIICAVISLFNYFFSAAISSFFCNDTITIATSQNAMEIISLGYIVYGISMIMNNIFNGLGDTKTPTLINILGFWIFQIPVTYYLISYCHYDYKTAIWIIPITEGLVCILYFIFFFKIKLLREELTVLKHF